MRRKIVALIEVDDDTAFQKMTMARFPISKMKWDGWSKVRFF